MDTDEVTIDVMRQAAATLRSVTSSVHDEARALRVLRDAADAALSTRLAEIEATSAYFHEDATSTVSWAAGGLTDLDLLDGLCAACRRHLRASEPRAG